MINRPGAPSNVSPPSPNERNDRAAPVLQTAMDLRADRMAGVLPYLLMARVHHWPKNVLVLAGVLLALISSNQSVSNVNVHAVLLGLASVCLIASGNYVINEILDADGDRFHPTKRQRPVADERVQLNLAYAEWLILATAGLALAAWLGRHFFIMACLFFAMALAYNIPPIRLKDRPYADILSEAANSPIRLLLGWFLVVPGGFPSATIVLTFWTAGAFAMSYKRLAEYRIFSDSRTASAYRRSFRHYDERRLRLYCWASGAAACVFACLYLMDPP